MRITIIRSPLKIVLAELLVATSLLTATLKFDGDITVQLQGDGPMNLAVINGNNNQQMRGVARVQGEISRKCRPEKRWSAMVYVGDHHHPERR